MRAADAIVSVLERAGVRVVFGVPGVHNLSLFDALWGSPIRVVITRHEGAAAHAADGYARATGGPGVVVTTTGPGAANALAGVGEAWAAGSPVLHVTTQVRAADLKAGVQRGILHQSPGQIEAFRPLVRFAETVAEARRGPSAVSAALSVALGVPEGPRERGGPTYVEIPFDLLDAQIEERIETASATPPFPRPPWDAAAEALTTAAAPVIWAGGGVLASTASAELEELAERLAAPVVTTYLGRTAIRADHPLAVALPPHEPAVRRLLADADVLLAVGTAFGATDTMGGALTLADTLVRIDIDPDELAKTPDAIAIRADACDGLFRLNEGLRAAAVDRSGAPFAAVAAELAEIRSSVRRSIAEDPRTREAAAFLDALEIALPREAIVACDMCVAGYWVGGYLPRYEPRTLLYPLGWGTLGFGLPAAIGAACALRAPVLAVVGDAGLSYYLGELATAHEQDLDLTVLCVNDRGYGMLRFDEERRFGRTFAADLFTPDLMSLAAAFDIPYAEARLGDASLGAAVARAIEDGGVHLIEVRAALFPPRTTSPRWNDPG